MQLDKFYLDVVSSDGSGCIGYVLQLDRVRLAATLHWHANGAAPRHRRTLRGTIPDIAASRLVWHCAPLALDGSWTNDQPAAAETTLWRDARGSVVWQVLAPAATAELKVDGEVISGWGYAERLRLDLAPWHLPIDTLRWGRFVAAGQSVVWIDWIHGSPRRWLWHNGVECVPGAMDDTALAWPGWRLEFGGGRTLRTGRLADTALARWSGWKHWLPRRIQAFDETKWCAAGTLSEGGTRRAEGWVIHERVRFR